MGQEHIMEQSNILGLFRIDDEIKSFDPSDTRSGRRAETLIKTDNLRVILVTMKAGAELAKHDAPGPITIHALSGRFTVGIEGQQDTDLDTGGLLAVHATVKHTVRAVEDGAFLLTIGWPGDQAHNHPTDI
jgi:quercetin dioxygenase-like cupin family protein